MSNVINLFSCGRDRAYEEEVEYRVQFVALSVARAIQNGDFLKANKLLRVISQNLSVTIPLDEELAEFVKHTEYGKVLLWEEENESHFE